MTGGRLKVAFVCVHNSCRSQMAEAIARLKYNDYFEVYSAGTELKDRINKDAVITIKRLYGIDMEDIQYPKLLSKIPPVDIIVTMGCNVKCPNVPSQYRFDWGLEDPSGQGAEKFEETARMIELKLGDMYARFFN